MRPRSNSPPHCVLLCESAIDALSAALLQLPQLPPHTLFASAAGLAHSIPAWLSTPSPLTNCSCGFDNDPPGQLAAQRLLERHPAARRRPAWRCQGLEPTPAAALLLTPLLFLLAVAVFQLTLPPPQARRKQSGKSRYPPAI